MPTTYEPIATTTLSSAQSSVTLSSIPGTYTDIVIIINGTNSTSEGAFRFYCNSDTGSNYSWTQLYGDGSSAASNRGSNDTRMTLGRQATTASTSIVQFMNYANTTTNKTAIGRGSPTTIVTANVGLWRSTAAITQLVISNEGGNIASGTTFTLYGIKAA